MNNNEIIILHGLNGKPYFEAVEQVARKNGSKVKYYETSIVKLFIRDIIKKQFSKNTIDRSFQNLLFRLKVPFIKDSTIIMGMAPFCFRLLWYHRLLKNNNFIYHTSHPDWGNINSMPRRYWIFTEILHKVWSKFLKQKKLKIISVTKFSETTLKNNFIINGNLQQIYHSVNTNLFTHYNNSQDNIFHIVFVGKFLYEKGLDTIVELHSHLDQNRFHFHIVGDGEYKQKIKNIFSEKNVTYYGWIKDKEEIAKIYSKGTIFLNPSIKINGWEELFGLVNIEAMASGLVVIASDHIGPSEIIENGKTGFLVSEKNVNEIKDILNKLYEDDTLLKKIQQNSINRALQFSLESISKQWEQIINE